MPVTRSLPMRRRRRIRGGGVTGLPGRNAAREILKDAVKPMRRPMPKKI